MLTCYNGVNQTYNEKQKNITLSEQFQNSIKKS